MYDYLCETVSVFLCVCLCGFVCVSLLCKFVFFVSSFCYECLCVLLVYGFVSLCLFLCVIEHVCAVYDCICDCVCICVVLWVFVCLCGLVYILYWFNRRCVFNVSVLVCGYHYFR